MRSRERTERHPVRGVVLMLVTACLVAAVVYQFQTNAGDVLRVVTVIPALIVATVLTGFYGFFDLYGRAPGEHEDSP